MKIYYFSILAVLLSCFLSSCGTNRYANGHYASSEAGVLELSDKDELKASGSLSLSSIGNGFNVQVGYSPIKHVAIGSSYIRMSHNGFFNSTTSGLNLNNELSTTKFNLFEGSIGTYYFLPLKKESKDIGILFDVYTGYGLGKVKNEYGGEASSNLNFNHYYLQGGLHLRMKWFGISYLVKRTKLDYTKGNINYVTWRSGYFQELAELTAAPFSVNGNFLRMNFYVKPFQLYFTFSKLERKGFEESFSFGSIRQHSTFPIEMINIGVTTEINDLINFIKRNKNRGVSGG